MSTIPVDHAATRAALTAVAGRTVALVAGIDDPNRQVVGLEWTTGETAAHLLIALRGFTDALTGRLTGWLDLIPATPVYRERMAGLTAATIAAEPLRDPVALARLIGAATETFLERSDGRSSYERVPTPWYGDTATLSLGAATALLLGEQLIHGHDLARTMDKPWPIHRQEALLTLPAPLSMMPIVLDQAAAQGVRAVYALHVRGGPSFALSVRDGTISVDPLQRFPGSIDCHLSADAVAFLLFGYGRLGLRSAIIRGKLLAWGRRPWLGFRLGSLFFDP